MRWIGMYSSFLFLLFTGCSSSEQEETDVDYDQMVMLDEEAGWSNQPSDAKIGQEVGPDLQEIVIVETPGGEPNGLLR